MFSLLRKSKLVVPVVLGVVLSVQAYACPPAKDGTVKPSHITSINIHQPGKTKDNLASIVNIMLPIGSGYRVEAKGTGSGNLGPGLSEGLKKGELPANVIFTYGRTGEIPPGRDIFKYLHQAEKKGMLSPLKGRFNIKPQFQEFVDDIEKGGHLTAPYVGSTVIFYNKDLIKTKDVPKSWKELANFDGKVAVPGSGCYGMRTLTALYNVLGEKDFEKLIKKADMPALETMKKDPRKSAEKPLSGLGAPSAVIKGDFKVGMGPLFSRNTLDGIASGAIGVIWPEEGAIAMPHILAVRANPNEADLALVDFVAKNMEFRKVILNEGVSSTLRGGQVHPLVKENDFRFIFIPIEKLKNPATHKKIIEIVEQNKPKG